MANSPIIMNLRCLIFSLLLCVSAASAFADIITCNDGSTIDAKVEEITDSSVRYRKASNPTGPIYSIPIASVATITYDNGTKDTFGTPIGSTPTTVSDEELMRYANDLTPNSMSSRSMSDVDLLRMYGSNADAKRLRSKAKRYSLIGWIGGGVLATTGLAIILDGEINGYHDTEIYGSLFIVPGVVLATCFNIRAYQLRKKASEIEIYSSSIIEDDILHFGDKSLTAGLSVMGNQMTRTQGYGLSLKFTF